MSRSPRLLMVGLDAVDGPLVRGWMEEGELPVLAGLAARGVAGPMTSFGQHMPESSWASLVSGCAPGDHGIYSWRIVKPGTVDRVRTAGGGARVPFWRVLRENAPEPAPRVALVDVPYTGENEDPGVIQISGWGLRVTREISTSPPELWDELRRRHPPYPSWINRDYVRGPLSERRYRRVLSRLADRRTDLALEVLSRSPWDLAVVNYTEPHYAGHAFMHHLAPIEPAPWWARFGARTGLLDAYRAADRSLGRLLEAAGPDADVMVFSTIGLRPNEAATTLLDQVMIALGYHVPADRPSAPASRRLVEVGTRVTPRFLRHRLRAMLPGGSYEALADSSWGEAIDWSRSRAPSEAEPGSAWIRINLAGREPAGIVSPEQREELIAEIRDDLARLVDDATGKPAIEELLVVSEIVPGENVGDLPDILIRWSPGMRIRAVRHPRVGRITDEGAHHARTEHTGAGFLVAAGPNLAAGPEAGPAREIDLAPTVLSLFGCPVPRAMAGEPLDWILREPPAAPREDIGLAIAPSWETSRASGG